MEDDFFLRNMKGVKPFKKNNKIVTKKKDNKTEKIIKKPPPTVSDLRLNYQTKKSNINNYNLIFGEINKNLKRGKIKIDRKIDLHGHSLIDAYHIFKKEIKKTYEKNKRCILIITGKGLKPNRNESGQKPKLFHGKIKNSIMSWIKEDDLKDYILTYQDAGFEHGGDGAIFIYLRKNKN